MNTTENSDDSLNPWERRIAPRYRRELVVGMEFSSSHFCQSHSINISATGLRLVVDQPLGCKRPVHLTLCLDEENVIEIDAKTVWQERLGSLGTHIVGVAFDQQDEAPQRRIRSWLKAQGYAA